MTKKMNETISKVNDQVVRSVDEYIELGTKVQDDMFKMAQQQLDGFREYTEFALKQQAEFFEQFQQNSKNQRELFLEGLRTWQSNVTDTVEKLKK